MALPPRLKDATSLLAAAIATTVGALLSTPPTSLEFARSMGSVVATLPSGVAEMVGLLSLDGSLLAGFFLSLAIALRGKRSWAVAFALWLVVCIALKQVFQPPSEAEIRFIQITGGILTQLILVGLSVLCCSGLLEACRVLLQSRRGAA